MFFKGFGVKDEGAALSEGILSDFIGKYAYSCGKMGLFLSKHVESILFSLRKGCFPSLAVAGCLWRRRFTPKRKKKGYIFCVNIAAHHLSKTAVIRLSWKYRLFSGIEKAGGGEKAGCLFPRGQSQNLGKRHLWRK